METEIRHMLGGDAEQVRQLSLQLGYDLTREETEEQIKKVLSLEYQCAFVAIQEGKLVGWIHGFISILVESKPFVDVGGLVVDESYRGRGIGKILLLRLKDWCLEKNIKTIKVRSNIKRERAHQFYLNSGFIETKQQKIFQLDL